MTTTNRVRAAVIGTGFIGTVHVEAARRAGAQVVGVLGSSGAKSEAVAQALGIARGYGSLDELLSDPDVDVVHVTSPNALHLPQALAAVEAGKNVICEKPLGIDVTQGRQLVDAARLAGVVNATCFNIRFYPVLHEAHELVRNGALGEPRFLTGSYHQDWLMYPTDWNWRLEDSKGGSLRAVADIGSHWLDLLKWIGGVRVSEVFADLHTFVPIRQRPLGEVQTFGGSDDGDRRDVEIHNDDAAGILLRFDNGARGAVTVSQVSAGRKNDLSFEVAGADDALMWQSSAPDRLWLGHRGRTNEELLRDPGQLSEAAAKVTFYPGGHVEGFGETFRGLFERVYAAIREGSSGRNVDFPTFQDGYDALCVTDAISRSAQSGSWEAVMREES